MAKLTSMPHQAIVDGFKGKVDFYVYRGQACARMWPRWPRRESYPDELANQQAFAYCNKLWRDLPEYIKQQYTIQAQGSRFTNKDLFVRAYMKGIDY